MKNLVHRLIRRRTAPPALSPLSSAEEALVRVLRHLGASEEHLEFLPVLVAAGATRPQVEVFAKMAASGRIAHDDIVVLSRRGITSQPGRTEAQIRADQQELDLAMHLAFRPEVVAEVAVHLSEESDWEAVANWCGGTIDAGPDGTDSGEWAAWIVLPDKAHVFAGMWIVQRHDLSFAVRHEVAGPSDRSVAQVRAGVLREAAETLASRDFLAPHDRLQGVLVDWLRVRAHELEQGDGS